MKRLALVQLCVLILIICTAAAKGTNANDEMTISNLMDKRIAILSYYYGGKMNFDDAQTNIARITAGQLLKEDVDYMKGFEKTEVDQITDYDIYVISCQRSNYGIIKGEVRIHWILRGQEGYWETEEEYYFTAECDERGTKLTQMRKS